MRDYRTGASAFAMFVLLSAASCVQPSSNEAKLPPATRQPAICPPVSAPVCAAPAGEPRTYWNQCLAQRDGAITATAGECPYRSSFEI